MFLHRTGDLLEQILFISIVILILFGPDKLPTIGKAIGTIVREFQTAMRPETTAVPPSVAAKIPRRKPRKKPKTKTHLTVKTPRTTKKK